MSSNVENAGISDVLIATDGSVHSDAAVSCGASLAARTRAHVTAIYVIDARLLAGHFVTHFSEVLGSGYSPGIVERVREYYHAHGQRVLERAAAICEHYDVACRAVLETGNVAKVLAGAATAADLLVMGKHGEDEEHETGFLGSVAEKVLRSVKRPVLLTPLLFREFHRALLAYDGSDAARRAMQALARLAVVLDIEVDAVELIEENEPTEALIEVDHYFKDFPVHVSTHYLTGDSLRVILDHAQEKECDLLVMGAYADETAESLGLGSTTEYLMRNSPVPVLVHH
jgi:nucleotide-binding universal stress UspA family protein